ncbi:MAG: TPM domain-containing protein [Bacteroidota bacterium]
MLKKYITLLLLFTFSIIASFSQTDVIPERPNPPKLVNDLSKEMPDFLSDQDEAQLEQKLQNFSNQTSNQIVIIIVDDLAELEPWDYATQLGSKWGVGQGKFDNGVVILIKPTGGKGQRKSFIAVGTGLEGAIPDITAKRIVENELNSNLANGNVYEAFDQTTDVIMGLAKGEINSDQYGQKNKKKKLPIAAIVIMIIIFILFMTRRGGRGNNGGLSMGSGFLLGSLLGGRSGGGFGGGSSGGFGGFGGGGFGGGGAGGSW